jgi:pseudouridylate synthase
MLAYLLTSDAFGCICMLHMFITLLRRTETCCPLQVHKTSRRDLPVVMARHLDGATTVSATMLLAHRAGIPIFVTGGEHSALVCTGQHQQVYSAAAPCLGNELYVQVAEHLQPCYVGIGGVHRGAESSMDISADLTELSRTPITVVCAGVKSILDIPRTMEVQTVFAQLLLAAAAA